MLRIILETSRLKIFVKHGFLKNKENLVVINFIERKISLKILLLL